MNEDYLWNKTGEPDEEVRELEEILGVLRYQPRKLVLPQDLPAPRKRNYYPLLAIAATFVLALLAAGLWLSLRSTNNRTSETASKPQAAPENGSSTPQKREEPQVANNSTAATPAPQRKQRRHLAVNPALAARKQREREEALAAKEQLVIALRLASEKLNQAQRRTQLPAVPNQIRNQHKVG